MSSTFCLELFSEVRGQSIPALPLLPAYLFAKNQFRNGQGSRHHGVMCARFGADCAGARARRPGAHLQHDRRGAKQVEQLLHQLYYRAGLFPVSALALPCPAVGQINNFWVLAGDTSTVWGPNSLKPNN